MPKRQVFCLTFLAVCMFMNLGCSSSLNKNYSYKPATYKFKGGEIGAKLIGSFSRNNSTTVQGSPYELFIWYETEQQVKGKNAAISLKLLDPKSNVLIKNIESIEEAFKLTDSGKFTAYFSIKELDLEYIQYVLDIEVKTISIPLKASQRVRLVFEKDYKEYRSNDLWDKIKGI